MKRTLITLLLLVFALPLVAGQPITTRERLKGMGDPRYRVIKHTFTASTNLDSVIILAEDSTLVETGDLEVNRTIFTLQFAIAEATASTSDWDVLWQVSSVKDASATIFPVVSAVPIDWITVETDQNDNSLGWVATFDAAAYKGMRVRAILSEADASTDTAVAVEVYYTYPRK